MRKESRVEPPLAIPQTDDSVEHEHRWSTDRLSEIAPEVQRSLADLPSAECSDEVRTRQEVLGALGLDLRAERAAVVCDGRLT